jgi:hypothetical protein
LGLCFAKDVLRLGEGHDTSRFLGASSPEGDRERCGKSEHRQSEYEAKTMAFIGPVQCRRTRADRLARLAVSSRRRDRRVERRVRRGDAVGVNFGPTLAGRL